MAEEARTFACPFFKRTPMDYSDCRNFQLNRIRDVKQHLARKHTRPPYCPCCYSIFDTELARDDHIRARCEARVAVEIHGVSSEQRNMLSQRSDSRQTVEEQWVSIWKILFPGAPPPESVYLDKSLSDEMLLIEQYMATEGVTILRNSLISHDCVQWMLPGNEHDLASFQNRVVRGVLGKVFEGMSRAVAEAETRQHPTRSNLLQATSSNHAFQAPTPSIIADTDSPMGQDPGYYIPPPGGSVPIAFSASEVEREGIEGANQPESQFDDIFKTMDFASPAQRQSQQLEEHANDQISEFSLLSHPDVWGS